MASLDNPTDMTQVIKFNVRGQIFHLATDLIALYPNCFFEKMLQQVEGDQKECILLDIDPSIFDGILSYMRCRGALPWFKTERQSEEFLTALTFLCLLTTVNNFETFLFKHQSQMVEVAHVNVPTTIIVEGVIGNYGEPPFLFLEDDVELPITTDVHQFIDYLSWRCGFGINEIRRDKIVSLKFFLDSYGAYNSGDTPDEMMEITRQILSVDNEQASLTMAATSLAASLLRGYFQFRKADAKRKKHMPLKFLPVQDNSDGHDRLHPPAFDATQTGLVCVDHYDIHPSENTLTWRRGEQFHRVPLPTSQTGYKCVLLAPSSLSEPLSVCVAQVPYGYVRNL